MTETCPSVSHLTATGAASGTVTGTRVGAVAATQDTCWRQGDKRGLGRTDALVVGADLPSRAAAACAAACCAWAVAAAEDTRCVAAAVLTQCEARVADGLLKARCAALLAACNADTVAVWRRAAALVGWRHICTEQVPVAIHAWRLAQATAVLSHCWCSKAREEEKEELCHASHSGYTHRWSLCRLCLATVRLLHRAHLIRALEKFGQMVSRAR